jgi:hypothetical protein
MNVATAITQALLFSSGEKIKVDGINGPKTSRALARHPDVARLEPQVASLASQVQPSTSSANWISADVVVQYARKAAFLTGLDAHLLMWFVSLEASQKNIMGVIHYDANSISSTGLHKGLGQLSADAWIDADRYARDRHMGIILGSFSKNWMNPEKSVLAMACYIKASEGFARAIKRDLKFTDELRYAIYNQGAGFVAKTIGGEHVTLGRQSPQANAIAAAARQQVLA